MFSFYIEAKAETVITADEGVRGGRKIPLKKVVDESVSKCPSVKRVFVYRRTGNGTLGKNDFSLDDVIMLVLLIDIQFVFCFAKKITSN